ncbi:MAG TPA: Stp1/IreP family PP2C-type Ser/Thr phosphatase [Terriglobales bacterium]|jgi:protein phosphatase
MEVRNGIELANLSDVGCQREQNEDSYGYWEPATEEAFQGKGRLVVVADGMGGYEGGQDASRIAVETVREIYESFPEPDPQSALLRAVQTAHERIRDFAGNHPSLTGMGTTCTAAVLSHEKLYFAHVGDSRLYLLRGAEIVRLTRDHSYVNRLVESGYIQAGEAENHPQRHILTAALGVGEELSVDSPQGPIEVQEGDVLLLCTDGLWGQVSDGELLQIARNHRPQESCRELVELARERGGPDNITVQVVRIGGNGRPAANPSPARASKLS